MPDMEVSVRQVFGLDSDMVVPGFSTRTEYVPQFDEAYCFDHDTTIANRQHGRPDSDKTTVPHDLRAWANRLVGLHTLVGVDVQRRPRHAIYR